MLPNAKTQNQTSNKPTIMRLKLEEDQQLPSENIISSAPLAKPESFSDLLADDLDDTLSTQEQQQQQQLQQQHSNSSLYLNLSPNLFIDDLNTSNMYYDDSISYKLETTDYIARDHHHHHHDSQSHIVQTKKEEEEEEEDDDELKSNLAWWPYTLDTSSYPATQNNSLNMHHTRDKSSLLAASSPPIEIKKCVRNKIQIVIESNVQSPPNSTAPNRRISTSTPRTTVESTRDWMKGQSGCIATPPCLKREHHHQQNEYDAYEYDYEESDAQANSSNNSFLLNSYSLNVSSFMMTNDKKKHNKNLTHNRPKMSASFDCSSSRTPNYMLLDTSIQMKPKASKSLAEANRISAAGAVVKRSHLRLTDSLRFNNHASSMSLGFSNRFRFTDRYNYYSLFIQLKYK